MRRPFTLPLTLVLAMAATGLGLIVPVDVSAQCVGPSISVPGAPEGPPVTTPRGAVVDTSVRLRPAQPVVVEGTFFFEGCEDTGPGGCGREGDKMKPSRDVKLELTQGGRIWLLGVADARSESEDFSVTWKVEIPGDARSGAATLIASGAQQSLVLD